MNAPPNVESPVPQGRGNRAPNDDRAGSQTNKHIDTHSAPPGQRIITAVPAGPLWRLKVGGDVHLLLPAVFSSRLEALIAAARLAERCSARLMP